MEPVPIICPACGELIIVRPETDGRVLVVPAHPDRITPFVDCVVNARVTAGGNSRLV